MQTTENISRRSKALLSVCALSALSLLGAKTKIFSNNLSSARMPGGPERAVHVHTARTWQMVEACSGLVFLAAAGASWFSLRRDQHLVNRTFERMNELLESVNRFNIGESNRWVRSVREDKNTRYFFDASKTQVYAAELNRSLDQFGFAVMVLEPVIMEHTLTGIPRKRSDDALSGVAEEFGRYMGKMAAQAGDKDPASAADEAREKMLHQIKPCSWNVVHHPGGLALGLNNSGRVIGVLQTLQRSLVLTEAQRAFIWRILDIYEDAIFTKGGEPSDRSLNYINSLTSVTQEVEKLNFVLPPQLLRARDALQARCLKECIQLEMATAFDSESNTLRSARQDGLEEYREPYAREWQAIIHAVFEARNNEGARGLVEHALNTIRVRIERELGELRQLTDSARDPYLMTLEEVRSRLFS